MMNIETVIADALVSRVSAMRDGGYRLVQIGCTKTAEGAELTYSFDKDYQLENLRLYWKENESVPSIQSVYLNAFTYENEFSELFGIPVSGMALDFEGRFYKIAEEKPFGGGITIQEAKRDV